MRVMPTVPCALVSSHARISARAWKHLYTRGAESGKALQRNAAPAPLGTWLAAKAAMANKRSDSKPIEDYGLIGNTISAALVARDGSIDWLCLPRFDSAACFAALLGGPENGRWLIAPDADFRTTRCYYDGTAVLETRFETDRGEVALIDFMPLSGDEDNADVVRIVRGIRGEVRMRMELILRFNYGQAVPWVRRRDYG